MLSSFSASEQSSPSPCHPTTNFAGDISAPKLTFRLFGAAATAAATGTAAAMGTAAAATTASSSAADSSSAAASSAAAASAFAAATASARPRLALAARASSRSHSLPRCPGHHRPDKNKKYED